MDKNHKHPHHHEHSVKEEANQHLEMTREEHQQKTLHAHESAEPKPHPQHLEQEHSHDHHAMMINEFKTKFWISIILSIPVVLQLNGHASLLWNASSFLASLLLFSQPASLHFWQLPGLSLTTSGCMEQVYFTVC